MLFVGFVLTALVAAAVGYRVGRRQRVEEPGTDDERELGTRSDVRVLRAVETLALGFVLYGSRGGQIFENSSATRLRGNRHQRPLVDAALADVSALAAVEGTATRVLDLFGPPRQVLEFKGESVRVDGQPVGVVVIVEDITEKRRAIDVRRDFVANVSHELKTPVAALGLLAEALIDSDDPAVTDRLSGRLHAEAIRLGTTIDDLLALSELESGMLSTPQPVAASIVVAGALERCAAAAELRGIDVEIDDRSPVAILGDRRQLVAAVGNLLDNAVKYSDPGSKVRLVVEARGSGDERRVVIEVVDAGIGIPASDRERIFERFYRVDPARSRNTGGTGLGLSIVRHIVANHGGTLELESAEGQGSTFRIELPTADGDGSEPGSTAVSLPEDDPDDEVAPNPAIARGKES